MSTGEGLTCFRAAVLSGLTANAKSLPSKYLFDPTGMALFEQLRERPEYYICRAEARLLAHCAQDIAALVGPEAQLVEFGSGRSRNARYLLDSIRNPRAYAAIDLCQDALLELCREIAAAYPGLAVFPLWADFLGNVSVPFDRSIDAGRILGLIPGSVMANLLPGECRDLLDRTKRLLGARGMLMVGLDERKTPERMLAAHNDPSGYAAALHYNLLHRINRELDGDFNAGSFEYRTAWNGREGRIEASLVSRRTQKARAGGRVFRFERCEPVQTEFSYKYSLAELKWLASTAGLEVERSWNDGADQVSLHLVR